jgi:uncharacterized protein (DUF779 family)
MIPRVTISPEAQAVVRRLQEQHGPLLFHQSGGCCDGSQPMCFAQDDFKIGAHDVCLGTIADCPFWMSADQFDYWKHTQLHIHLVAGRGSSFSLEIPMGVRFITQSRLFTPEESNQLEAVRFNPD